MTLLPLRIPFGYHPPLTTMEDAHHLLAGPPEACPECHGAGGWHDSGPPRSPCLDPDIDE